MSKDNNFYIALAYTAVHDQDLDLPAFRQKVQDNQKILDSLDSSQPLPKAQAIDRSKLGF